MELLYLLLGIALGALTVWLVFRSKVAAQQQLQEAAQQQLADERRQYDNQLQQLRQQHDDQLRQLRQQQDELLDQLRQQQKEEMQQQLALVREQMTTASEKLLRERADQLSQNNKEQLSTILNPLQENILQMKREAENMRRDHTVSLERLDASIKMNWEREKAMGEQAERLAQALTGENKVQGNFGELRLKQILQDMGLEEGTQFEEQTTMRDEQGRTITDDDRHRMIPDVVLHFPDQRDVIIDSKMSFTAYDDYCNAPDGETRNEALRRHIQSIRSHVKELAQKQYFKYTKKDKAKLDFVLMYVFQESALQLALLNDPTLWKDAYDQGVVISGSQTLYMTLRVLEMTWKQVRQVENQENIMKCANTLVERVQAFAERFAKVDEMLHKTRKSFDDLSTVTAASGLSITTAARNLLKYGAQENKKKRSLAASPTPDALPQSEAE